MFEEVVAVIDELKVHIQRVQRAAIFGGDYFHALALTAAYNKLIEFVDTRTADHPEVQRVPALRTILLDHFMTHADKHINLYHGTIFSESQLGGPRTLREWQEAGYHTRRSASNYQSRLRYWQALYDNAPLQFQQKVDTPGEIFNTQRTYQSSFISPKGKIPGRVRNRYTKADVSYESVISDRNRRYGEAGQLVPWWRVLNYGTGGQGYPVSPGLHFIEDAERTIPGFITTYADHFEQFMSDTFDSDVLTSDDILTVETWIRSHVKVGAEYIPSLDVARILSFGVPF